MPPASHEPPVQIGPMPWEDFNLPFLGRFAGTLLSTFQPVRSLRSVAHGPIAPAAGFFVLSSLPWMVLWAILPFTHTLLFGPSFALTLTKGAQASQIQPDVLRAASVGFALSALGFMSWAFPFASLTRAFCTSPAHALEAGRAAWRTALYRVWIIPCGFTLWSLILWGAPDKPSAALLELGMLACQLLPRLLVLIHCQAMARYVGASTLGALGVAVVPVALEWAVGLLLWQGAREFLPPEARQIP